MRRPLRARSTSATSAMIPPSPWLSARITSSTYLRVTIMTSDHTISDVVPYTFVAFGCSGCPPAKIVWTV